MSLNTLSARLAFAEGELHRAMERDAPTEERVMLLRSVADILDSIEAHVPVDRAESRDKAYFFLSRGMRRERFTVDNRDLDIALILAGTPDAAETFNSAPPRASMELSTGDLISFVSESKLAMSIVDPHFRYIASSPRHARLYGTRPVRLIGCNMFSVIPEGWRDAARHRMRRALLGEPQEFMSERETPDGAQIVRFALQPCRLGANTTGVMSLLCDVTEEELDYSKVHPKLGLPPESHIE